jgi:hypothetical protein
LVLAPYALPSPRSERVSEHPVFQWVGNVVSLAAIAGTLAGWLPLFAALVAIVWYSIQIWESHTVREYLSHRQKIRKTKRVAKLRAREKIILAQLDALETVRVAKATAKEVVAVAAAEAARQATADSIEAETKI